MMVNVLAYGSCNNTNFVVLTSSCHLLLYHEPDFLVVFVREYANGVAHTLARQSYFAQNLAVCYDVHVWLEKDLRNYCTTIDH